MAPSKNEGEKEVQFLSEVFTKKTAKKMRFASELRKTDYKYSQQSDSC